MRDLTVGDTVIVQGKEYTFIKVLGHTLNSVARAVVEGYGARKVIALQDIKR